MANQPEYTHVSQPDRPASLSFDPQAFTISAPSKSDVHASPLPSPRYILNAPTSYHPALPLSSFRSARVSLTYTPRLQYDHAGLVLILPSISEPTLSLPTAENVTRGTAWVKAGLEAKDGHVYLSVVTKPGGGWCDWSLHSLPVGARGDSAELGGEVSMTVEFVRSKNALLVNHVAGALEAGGTEEPGKSLLRKIPWVFLDEDDKVIEGDKGGDDDRRKAWIGAFAARPDPEGQAGDERLQVKFRGLKIESS